MAIFYKVGLLLGVIISIGCSAAAQPVHLLKDHADQDSLRGSIGEGRKGWNVLRYDISVTPDIDAQTISGSNEITLYDSGFHFLQIDLQEPMHIDSAFFEDDAASFLKKGNAYFFYRGTPDKKNNAKPGIKKLKIFFSGKPHIALQPPWDGGWIWAHDELNRPFVSVACQGVGASIWYPCKDHQSDEPDDGASLRITVPDGLTAVGNGKLASAQKNGDGTTSWRWEVSSPINSYLIVPYIGTYTHFRDSVQGENGRLLLDYYVLDYQLEKAKKHFEQVKPMLQCFEKWMGPYPFYKDGYKLVEAPHLGMEHQSAIAYGNKYRNGYAGLDRSGTGWGNDWDFIIVHESGHEWFGNNITAKDIADMWIHEAFTTYSETLFVECCHGRNAASAYVRGQRKNIANDKPIIGKYGINKAGSSDMYDKGANMLHTIRQIVDDDEKFRELLRGLNKEFYHQTVTTKQIEDYIENKTGRKLDKVFDQYLRTNQIPELQYRKSKEGIWYQWAHCVPGFDMPLRLTNGRWLQPRTIPTLLKGETILQPDPDFYITLKQENTKPTKKNRRKREK